jgi:hypothetical protein
MKNRNLQGIATIVGLVFGCGSLWMAPAVAQNTTESTQMDAEVTITGGAVSFECAQGVDFGDITITADFGAEDVTVRLSPDGSSSVFEGVNSSSAVTVANASTNVGQCTLAGLADGTTAGEVSISGPGFNGKVAMNADTANSNGPASVAAVTVHTASDSFNKSTVTNGQLTVDVGGSLTIPKEFSALNDGDYIGQMTIQADFPTP